MDNLSYCAARAKEENISYGKYMAIHFVPVHRIEVEFDAYMKECKFCKSVFYPSNARLKYCSSACAANANRRSSLERYRRLKKGCVNNG